MNDAKYQHMEAETNNCHLQTKNFNSLSFVKMLYFNSNCTKLCSNECHPQYKRALIEMMTCHQTGYKPLSINQWWPMLPTHICAPCHDDVIKWKHFPRYWPFVRGIHRSPVNSPHRGQWRGHLMFSLICTLINSWVNNGKAGDLKRHCTHYDVTVMPH